MIDKCPKCESTNLYVMVPFLMVIPIEFMHNCPKSKLQDERVETWGVTWERAHFTCKSYGWGKDIDKLTEEDYK